MSGAAVCFTHHGGTGWRAGRIELFPERTNFVSLGWDPWPTKNDVFVGGGQTRPGPFFHEVTTQCEI